MVLKQIFFQIVFQYLKLQTFYCVSNQSRGGNFLNENFLNPQRLRSAPILIFEIQKTSPFSSDKTVDRKYINYLEVLLQVGSGQVQQVSYKKIIFMTTCQCQSFEPQQKRGTEEKLSVYLDKY